MVPQERKAASWFYQYLWTTTAVSTCVQYMRAAVQTYVQYREGISSSTCDDEYRYMKHGLRARITIGRQRVNLGRTPPCPLSPLPPPFTCPCSRPPCTFSPPPSLCSPPPIPAPAPASASAAPEGPSPPVCGLTALLCSSPPPLPPSCLQLSGADEHNLYLLSRSEISELCSD